MDNMQSNQKIRQSQRYYFLGLGVYTLQYNETLTKPNYLHNSEFENQTVFFYPLRTENASI